MPCELVFVLLERTPQPSAEFSLDAVCRQIVCVVLYLNIANMAACSRKISQPSGRKRGDVDGRGCGVLRSLEIVCSSYLRYFVAVVRGHMFGHVLTHVTIDLLLTDCCFLCLFLLSVNAHVLFN